MPSNRRPVDERERALDALAIARRDHLDLGLAASRVGLRPDVVLRYAGAGFEQRAGRWVARPFDAIARDMTVLTPDGPKPVRTHDSRQATEVSRHHNAVRHYIETGDASRLVPFRGRAIRTSRGLLPLATEPSQLDRLAEGAELAYDVYLRF
jgi:hypothetical protein